MEKVKSKLSEVKEWVSKNKKKIFLSSIGLLGVTGSIILGRKIIMRNRMEKETNDKEFDEYLKVLHEELEQFLAEASEDQLKLYYETQGKHEEES